MQKQLKQNFIQLPLNTFKKKSYPIPHFLFETKLQRNQKNLQQIKKLIESQQYEYIGQISEERNLYCCKQKTNDRLVVIQIKQVGSKNNKNIYLSVNLTSALKKDIRKHFMLKNWKILDKIYLQDQKGQSGLVMLEYNFVESDLRNFIKRQFDSDDKRKHSEINKICEDIIENLCYYHLQSTALLDIRPQTIMLEDGKWFILHGDNAITNKSTEFGSSMSKSVGFRPISCSYLSPMMYESFIKNDITLTHNSYKSDVYSLGLIIWELLTIGTLQPSQVKSRLQNRKQAHVAGVKEENYFNLRQKIIIQNNKAYMIPNVLRMMLQQNQDLRNYIIQICLCINFTSSLFTKILVPFQKFFKKQIIDINSSSRKKIQYQHAFMEYQGDTLVVFDDLVKHGRGAIMYNNVKVFDGEWQNNLPHGKCSVSFSEMWSYEGMMQNGKLHGQGILTFNGIRIGGTKWIKNLQQDVITNSLNLPQPGYYLICPDFTQQPISLQKRNSSQLSNITNTHFANQSNNQSIKSPSTTHQLINAKFRHHNSFSMNSQQQYKLYFQQLHNNKLHHILNFTKIAPNEIGKILQILLTRKLFLNTSPYEVEIYEQVKYQRYHAQKSWDLIRIGLKTNNKKISNKNSNTNIQQTQSRQLIQFKDSKNNKRQNKLGVKQIFKLFPHTQFISNSKQNTQMRYIDIILPTKNISIVLHKLLNYFSLTQTFSSFQNISQTQTSNTLFILPYLNLSYCSLTEDQFRDVIECGIGIQSINISKCPNLSDLAVKYLAQCPTIQQSLIELNIQGLKITNQALQQLKYFDSLKRIKILNMSHCQKLSSDKIAQFLCDDRLSGLETLQIAGLSVNHRGLQKIIVQGSLRSLAQLNIGSCHQITESTLIQLIKSPQLSNLKSFECYSTTIKDIFLQVLSNEQQSQSLPVLSQINLSGSINLTIYGISKFLLSKNSKSLISINLSNLDITDDFVQLLGKRNLLNPYLTELNLSACYKVSDKGIKQLLKSQRLINLKRLDLSKTNISNDTLFLLSQSSQRKLTQVKFYKCTKMNDLGFEKFLLSPAINKVKKLQIGGTSVKQLFFTTMASEKALLCIQELYLNECQQINENSLCQLFGSKRMMDLSLIDISSTRFSTKVIQTVQKNPFLKSHLLHLITNNCLNFKGEELSMSSIPFNIFTSIQGCKSMLKNSPQQLTKSSSLLKMSQLELSNQIPQIDKLFSSNYIINLSKLQLKWQQCTLSLKNLSHNLALNNFKQLSLLGSKFDEQKLVDLIKSPTIKGLQILNLSWTDITNQTLGALATSQFISSLRVLNLSKCCGFNDKGLVKFLQSAKASLLMSLDLRSTLITNTSLQALSKSKTIKSLTRLICRSCPNISEIGFKEYFTSGNCATLRELDVGWTRVEGNLFSYISKSKTLQLNSLKIAGLKKVEFQLNKFLITIGASSLQQLQLNFSQISISTIQTLISSKYLQTLQRLQLLGYDFIGSQQKAGYLIKLLESINMNKITTLKLTFMNCPDKLSQKIFDTLHKNLHVIQKLCIIQANHNIVQKGKKLLKKCEITYQD